MEKTSNSNDYVVIYLYYEEYKKTFINKISGIIKNIKKENIIIVYNKLYTGISTFQEIYPDAVYKEYNGDYWEFGAYQIGLNAINEMYAKNYGVYIINDTVGSHTPFNGWLSDKFINKVNENKKLGIKNFAVGELDTDAYGFWIRSCLIYISENLLKEINYKVEFNIKNSIKIYKNNTITIVEHPWFSSEYINSKIAWLTKGGVSGWAGGYSNEDFNNKITRKLCCIMTEQKLSDNLKTNDGLFVNYIPDKFFENILFKIVRRVQLMARGSTYFQWLKFYV